MSRHTNLRRVQKERQRRRTKRQTTPAEETMLPTTYDGMARDLVLRGLASPAVLGPHRTLTHHVHAQHERTAPWN